MKAFKFAPMALEAAGCERLAAMAIQRTLVARVNEANAQREQASVVARLISSIALPSQREAKDDPNVVAIMDHVCGNVIGRLDLLFVWLHREHGESMAIDTPSPGKDTKERPMEIKKEGDIKKEKADEDTPLPMDVTSNGHGAAHKTDGNGSKRYDSCVAYALDRLNAALPAEGQNAALSAEDRLLARVVMELPAVGPAAMDFIRQCSTQRLVGLATLRDLLLTRPACRREGLALLLEFARSFDPVLRKNAIYICGKFYTVMLCGCFH